VRWWKRAWARFVAFPLLTVVGVLTLIHAYKTVGAEELRRDVYQPLFVDVVDLVESIQAIGSEKPALMMGLTTIQKTGALQRVPTELRDRLLSARESASTLNADVLAIRELVLREMSFRIMRIRSEQEDRAWHDRAVRNLQEISKSRKGIADSTSFMFRHEGRSRGYDPKTLMVLSAGGPAFVVRDWVEYPGSVAPIEELWSDVDYLYFNDRTDAWYYQLTREDLARVHSSLAEFIKPVHETLLQNREFKAVIEARPRLRTEAISLREAVADRVRDPKQLKDLLTR
jgi:hypothetical protein